MHDITTVIVGVLSLLAASALFPARSLASGSTHPVGMKEPNGWPFVHHRQELTNKRQAGMIANQIDRQGSGYG